MPSWNTSVTGIIIRRSINIETIENIMTGLEFYDEEDDHT